MIRPDRRGFSVRRGIHAVGNTLSRISIRFTASVRLRGGGPLDACSTRDVAEVMKGMCCDSTLSSTKSSEVMGSESGGGFPVSGPSARRWDLDSLWGTWILAEVLIFGPVGGYGGVRQTAPHWRLS